MEFAICLLPPGRFLLPMLPCLTQHPGLCCSPANNGCTWSLGGTSSSTSLRAAGTECTSGTVTLTVDTPTKDSSMGATCPKYVAVVDTSTGVGVLLAPTAVCQAPFSTASGVSLKPDGPITIRSLIAADGDIAPPFTLRFTAPNAAGPVDVEVLATLACTDLPGAGFAIPPATSGYTLELILPHTGRQPGETIVLARLSEVPCPAQPPPRQVNCVQMPAKRCIWCPAGAYSIQRRPAQHDTLAIPCLLFMI